MIYTRLRTLAGENTAGALIARIAVDRMLAVDRLGQNLGAGGLAGAARADEQVGMGQPSGLDLLFQRLGNMLLTDDVRKRFRSPFSVKRHIFRTHFTNSRIPAAFAAAFYIILYSKIHTLGDGGVNFRFFQHAVFANTKGKRNIKLN